MTGETMNEDFADRRLNQEVNKVLDAIEKANNDDLVEGGTGDEFSEQVSDMIIELRKQYPINP